MTHLLLDVFLYPWEQLWSHQSAVEPSWLDTLLLHLQSQFSSASPQTGSTPFHSKPNWKVWNTDKVKGYNSGYLFFVISITNSCLNFQFFKYRLSHFVKYVLFFENVILELRLARIYSLLLSLVYCSNIFTNPESSGK